MKAKIENPQILLIGDSIRMGYCAIVKAELEGVADVRYPDGNGCNTQHVLISLGSWAKLCSPEETAAVQFNCGHWDVAHWDSEAEPLTSLGEYEHNMERIITRLRGYFPKAVLIAATTTPMNPSYPPCSCPRTNEEIRQYNAALIRAAEKYGVRVNDLFGVAEDWDSSCYRDYCHFQEPSYLALGKATAEFLRKVLDL